MQKIRRFCQHFLQTGQHTAAQCRQVRTSPQQKSRRQIEAHLPVSSGIRGDEQQDDRRQPECQIQHKSAGPPAHPAAQRPQDVVQQAQHTAQQTAHGEAGGLLQDIRRHTQRSSREKNPPRSSPPPS